MVKITMNNGFGLGDRLRNEACAKPVLGGEANSKIFNKKLKKRWQK
jgi:hypothetical protein